MNDKYDLAIRLAKRLLTLPTGSWPEVQQAERDLSENLPGNQTAEEILEVAARQTTEVHADRMPWLLEKGRRYTMADMHKVYPALPRYE